MKKYALKISGTLLLATLVFLATTQQAHAQLDIFSIGSIFGLGPGEAFNFLLALVFNFGLKIMSWLLAIAGSVLNFSITLTLNIKSFVDNAPAIYTTWRTIRDISGIFLIFFLLYDALQLILGLKSPKWGDSIKNIVMAGILINFSFFFAGLGIDVSNVVSMQIYNAIAPANSLNRSATLGNHQVAIEEVLADGGLSNIFMSALQIPKLYDVSRNNSDSLSALGSSNTNGGVISDTFKIVMVGIVGILVEFAAAMSFFAAALAFIGRFVLLLFLLAFSPIWFLSFLPNVGTYTEKWTSTYKSMLVFMPVYLILMYLAMNVLTTTPMFGIRDTAVISATAGGAPTALIDSALAQSQPAAAASSAAWYQEYLLLAVNATIVIFFLNLPLVAAASIAGSTLPLLKKTLDRFGADKIWKTVGAKAGTNAYQGSVGRAASKIAQSENFKNLAANNKMAGWALAGTRGAASGYDKKLSEQVAKRTGFAESLGHDQRAVNVELTNIRNTRAQLAAGAITQTVADTRIRASQSNISQIKTQRKFDYATRINTGSIDTLYMKRARKNKAAAAKIHVDVWEADLKDKKEDMKVLKAEINNVQNQINAQPGGTATPAQLTTMAGLQGRQTALQNTIDRLEQDIGDAKLVH